MTTYIGPKGYSILKECLNITEQELIRNDLKVTPFIPKSSMAKPSPFPIYRESLKKILCPTILWNKKHMVSPNILKLIQEKRFNYILMGNCGNIKFLLSKNICNVLKKEVADY